MSSVTPVKMLSGCIWVSLVYNSEALVLSERVFFFSPSLILLQIFSNMTNQFMLRVLLKIIIGYVPNSSYIGLVYFKLV